MNSISLQDHLNISGFTMEYSTRISSRSTSYVIVSDRSFDKHHCENGLFFKSINFQDK